MSDRLSAVVLCVVAILVPSFSRAEILLDRVVAVVNQEVITWSELYKNMELDASPQLKALNDDERRKIFKENEAFFLESLITLRLQLQEAANQGMGVSDEEVREGIDGVMKKYNMTEPQFKESLKKEGYTYDEYRKRLKEQILISKLVNHQIKSKVLVTDTDVKQYVKEIEERGENSEGFKLSQIFFKKPQTEEGRRAVEEKATAIVAELRAGKSFGELAVKYSEDSTASAGGEIGVIRKNQLMKEFAEAVAQLKPGEVSNPFWTERGLHIIMLQERIAPKGQKELEEDARKKLSERIFTEKYNAWIKSLREKAFIEIRL